MVTLQFLGSGDAFGSGGRFQACIHVRSASASVLLDCGASSVIAMKRFGVTPSDIEAILISHVHGDHFGGIPFFILDAQFLSKRETPLLIAGPPGIEERVRAAQEALFANSSKTVQKFEISFAEWQDRVPSEVAGVRVTPFEVVHGSSAPPFGLRMEVEGRTIAYSGDTEWTPALVKVSRDADLFICEANFYGKAMKFHLDYKTLMSHRGELSCKRLMLTHMNTEMIERSDFDVERAYDGLIIEL
jgi:ribonuclease BN (tRNA processing enzyme)